MKRSPLLALLALAMLGALATLGCKKEATDAPVEPATTEAAAEEEDVLAGLSEADRAAVLAQKICFVSGGALGSMGAPIKVTVEGRDVFVCCEACIDAVKEDPAKYLAMLDSPASGDDAAPAAEGEAEATQ